MGRNGWSGWDVAKLSGWPLLARSFVFLSCKSGHASVLERETMLRLRCIIEMHACCLRGSKRRAVSDTTAVAVHDTCREAFFCGASQVCSVSVAHGGCNAGVGKCLCKCLRYPCSAAVVAGYIRGHRFLGDDDQGTDRRMGSVTMYSGIPYFQSFVLPVAPLSCVSLGLNP